MAEPVVKLSGLNQILVQQVREMAEWIGFETRNKYQVLGPDKQPIAFAAEQQKGILGFLLRQYLGHWRKFDVHFFTLDRQLFMVGHHPFRWFFERIEIRNAEGQALGAIQKRFSILSKRFDVENERGLTIMEVSSPIWRIWTFTFMNRGKKMAEVKKKWSGLFSEAFTDRDNFMVEYSDSSLSEAERQLVMAAAVFVDLLYFEKKK
ncbi:MAG: phospholipid scramblase-related protein [Pseudobdellovibrionaceae bacterium]